MTLATLPATAFKSPAVILFEVVDYDMYTKFRSQFDKASQAALIGDCWPPTEIVLVSGARRAASPASISGASTSRGRFFVDL